MTILTELPQRSQYQTIPIPAWRFFFIFVIQPGMSANLHLHVGFIGAGKMATALAKGFIRANLVTASQILASDPLETARMAFEKEIGAKTTESNGEVLKFAPVIVLSVKPGQVAAVLEGLREPFTRRQLLVSIAAGVSLGHDTPLPTSTLACEL